jgi:hypothetical protein
MILGATFMNASIWRCIHKSRLFENRWLFVCPPEGQADAALVARSNECLELFQAVRNSFGEFEKRWNNSLQSKKFEIAKEYIDGRIGVLVKLNREPWPHPRHTGETIWPEAKGAIFKSRGHYAIWVYEFDSRNASDRCEWRDDGVLLRVVEQMQAVNFFARTAWVNRETSEEFLRIVSRRFYSVTRGFIVPLAATRGERRPSILCTTVEPHEFPHGVIERGAEIVDRISENKRESGRDLFIEAQFDGDIAGLRIIAHSRRIAVSPHKPIENGFKIADVMLGPI